jgi:hypothetical protein
MESISYAVIHAVFGIYVFIGAGAAIDLRAPLPLNLLKPFDFLKDQEAPMDLLSL